MWDQKKEKTVSTAVIHPHELAELRKGGKTIDLIDVRTPVEYREVHLEDARNVPLVPLHRHQVVPALSPDLLDDLLLAKGRVERHQRALEVQNLEPSGQGRDLVTPITDCHLAEEQVVLGRPGVDPMPAPAERIAGGGPTRLAVSGPHADRVDRQSTARN